MAAEYGASVSVTGGSHLRVTLPSGGFVVASNTPRRVEPSRVHQDIRRELRRQGIAPEQAPAPRAPSERRLRRRRVTETAPAPAPAYKSEWLDFGVRDADAPPLRTATGPLRSSLAEALRSKLKP